jgi:hypothetical protein
MTRTLATLAVVSSLGLLAAPTVSADAAGDDLLAVKRAVASAEAPRPAVEDPAPKAAPAKTSGSRGEMRWFRVRVEEKAGKRGRVSVNLPLGLVRMLGDDWRPHDCRDCEGGRGPTLGEILRALDSGQNLVEIEDADASVRVWVD